jgi:hypothetical protein
MWAVMWHVQISQTSANSLGSGFWKKPFYQNRCGGLIQYLGDTSVKIHLPLSSELWNQIHSLYSKLTLYKLWRGGKLLQSASLHSRDNIYCESRDQEQEQNRPLQLIVNSKPLLFSRPKYCCTLSAYLTSSLQTEGCFSSLTKEAISSLMFFVFNIE